MVTLTRNHLGIITLINKDLDIITLISKDIYIITLDDKDLGKRRLITFLIVVFNDQST